MLSKRFLQTLDLLFFMKSHAEFLIVAKTYNLKLLLFVVNGMSSECTWRERCPNPDFFSPIFSRVWAEYRDLLCESPYLV